MVPSKWSSLLEPPGTGKQPFQPPRLSCLAWTERRFRSAFPNALANSSGVITEQGHTRKSSSSVASCVLLKATLMRLRLVPALLCFCLTQDSGIISKCIFSEDWGRDDSSTTKSVIYVISRKAVYMKMSILCSVVKYLSFIYPRPLR